MTDNVFRKLDGSNIALLNCENGIPSKCFIHPLQLIFFRSRWVEPSQMTLTHWKCSEKAIYLDFFQVFLGSHTRQLQNVWWSNGTCRNDHLPPCTNLLLTTVANKLHSHRAFTLEHYLPRFKHIKGLKEHYLLGQLKINKKMQVFGVIPFVKIQNNTWTTVQLPATVKEDAGLKTSGVLC